jgi:hypothetical protein
MSVTVDLAAEIIKEGLAGATLSALTCTGFEPMTVTISDSAAAGNRRQTLGIATRHAVADPARRARTRRSRSTGRHEMRAMLHDHAMETRR